MSPARNQCKAGSVLQEVEHMALHDTRGGKRNTVFNPYLNEYVTKRTKKHRYLQTVLATSPNKYDNEWIGDETVISIPRQQLIRSITLAKD